MSYVYQLQRKVVAHKIYNGCSSCIKKAGTVLSDSSTNEENKIKYEKEERPERIFNAKWFEGRPWLKYDRDWREENAMTCTTRKYG